MLPAVEGRPTASCRVSLADVFFRQRRGVEDGAREGRRKSGQMKILGCINAAGLEALAAATSSAAAAAD